MPKPVHGSKHEFKYRLALVAEGICVLRYDNEVGKGEHKHNAPSYFGPTLSVEEVNAVIGQVALESNLPEEPEQEVTAMATEIKRTLLEQTTLGQQITPKGDGQYEATFSELLLSRETRTPDISRRSD